MLSTNDTVQTSGGYGESIRTPVSDICCTTHRREGERTCTQYKERTKHTTRICCREHPRPEYSLWPKAKTTILESR